MKDQAESLFTVEVTASAQPGRFRGKVESILLGLGCKVDRVNEQLTWLEVVEPDGRTAVWVTLSRAEKNDKPGRGWTVQQGARDTHRALEAEGRPVMYALQDQNEVRVVPGDYLVAGVTLDEGQGGNSEHLRIMDRRWPSLRDYIAQRA